MDPGDDELLLLIEPLTLEEKTALLTGQDSWSMRAVPSIGLRSIVMSDGPVGVRGTTWDERDPSLNFPSPTSIAASWDRGLADAVGRGLGSEARRKSVDVVLAPNVNLQRTPFGGRHFEAFSEDPVLTSEVATHYVAGIQHFGVAATVKHYVANDSETDRFDVDVRVDERTLRELYLQAFEGPIVEAEAWLVMSAYNAINGATASENRLLTTPLQDEWGFAGVVVSDWTAVRSLEAAHHPQDVAMPGPSGAWGTRLVEAVRAGEIDEKVVDRKVMRILRLAARVGALADYPPSKRADHLSPAQLTDLARTSSREGMVLLSNRGMLPLNEPAKIAVLGEAAAVARTQGGGSATVVPPGVVSPLQGISRRWPTADVSWSLGAAVQQGLAPLDPKTYLTSDGRPGMLVRYLDNDGNERDREVRRASWLVWFNTSSAATTAATIELAFRYAPATAGAVAHLGVGGLADVDVIADGQCIATEQIRSAVGADPSAAVLNPPFASVDVPMARGTVDIVVRFRPVRGGIPDALALRVGTVPPFADHAALIEDAARTAAESDVAIVVVGTTNEDESEGFDRTTLRLPGAQDALVHAVATANPRTVVVVNAGAPVTMPWRDEVSAVIATWFPGQEFGHALADVLSGDTEPGGRLPVTWPDIEDTVPVREVAPVDGQLEYREGLHIGYRAWMRAGATPAYPFGHGLGYTHWRLSGLSVTPLWPTGTSTVFVQVENVGQRSGKCVVQAYLERASESAVERPARWLAGFETTHLRPHQRSRVTIELPWRRFAHWERDAWRVEQGSYRLIVGLSSTDIRLATIVDIEPGAEALESMPS